MSLSGLDDAEVQEAYQHANTEAGGWLLLKYNSRASVDLLGRGKGGVHDARAAIAKYEDPSPLFGLIVYRRRKVLIKYVPEGTSRVLLARTAVHWQDILEKFAPYETTLEIKTADGLNDTSLASSFPLHTASPAASSNRLHEISEDAEAGEDTSSTARPSIGSTVSTASYLSTQRQRADRRSEQRSPPPAIRVEDVQVKTPSGAPPLSPPRKPHISQYLVRDDAGQRSITSLSSASSAPTSQFANKDAPVEEKRATPGASDASTPSSPTRNTPETPISQQTETTAATPAPTEHRRTLRGVEMLTDKPPPPVETPMSTERTLTRQQVSSQTAAETSGKLKFDDDPYDFSRFDLKPKVRLGPRPVAPTDKAKRPSVAGVASVPATYRPTTAKKQESNRPKSQGPMVVPGLMSQPVNVPAPPPIPDLPEYTPRPLSRGSIKSLPSHKSTAMTPDKIRLMKAVELRKKQMRKSNPQADTFVPPPESEVPEVPKLPETPITSKTEMEKLQESDVPHVDELAANKADSGIAMDYDQGEKEAEKAATEPVAVEVPEPDAEAHEGAETSPTEQTEVPAAQSPVQGEPGTSKVDTPRVGNEQASETTKPEPDTAAVERELEPAIEQSASPLAEETQEPESAKASNGLGITTPPEDDLTRVPTIVMADGTRPVSSTSLKAPVDEELSTERDVDEDKTGSGDELETPDRQVQRKNSDIAKRRRGFVEPLHIDPDGEFSSDDEFMQELQSATLQEAKPVMVSKSPVAAYFPRRPSGNSVISELSVKSVNINRSSTLPVDFTEMQDRLSPEPAYGSYSPTPLRETPPMEKFDPLAAMRRNVSTGISRRIQALAEKSSRENSPQGSSSTRPISPESLHDVPAFVDPREVRRSPPPHASRASSFRAMHRQSARLSSHQAWTNQRQQPENTSAVYSVQQDPSTNRNSVSVSARIVRPTPVERTDSSEGNDELHEPKLVISHERGTPSQTSVPQLHPIDTNQELQSSQTDATPSRGASPTATRSPTETRAMHSASRFGRHKPTPSVSGPSVEDFPPPPTNLSSTNAASTTSADDNAASQKESSTRTSRFFKRMSNIGSKRKSGVPQSIASSTSPASERGSVVAPPTAAVSGSASKEKADTPPAVVVGDLNIQFPDSLLWKRRIVEIDDSGHIAFSIPQAMEHQRANSKKYPLSDFKLPYVPDLDRQELPNSLMLDSVVDGTTLQLACEDGMTHRQVVHVLKSYWRAWT